MPLKSPPTPQIEFDVEFDDFVRQRASEAHSRISKLEPFADKIMSALGSGGSYTTICAWLSANGVQVTRQTLTAWIRRRQARIAKRTLTVTVPSAAPLIAQAVLPAARTSPSSPSEPGQKAERVPEVGRQQKLAEIQALKQAFANGTSTSNIPRPAATIPIQPATSSSHEELRKATAQAHVDASSSDAAIDSIFAPKK